MKPREKLLAIVVAALVAVLGLRAGISYVDGEFAKRQTRLDAATAKLQERQLEVAKGRNASRQLKEWSERSLPADRATATSLYQKWLLEIAGKTAGIRKPHVGAVTTRAAVEARRFGSRSVEPAFEQATFTLSGEGSLTQIVRLLYAFYSANHLHRVAVLNIAPAESGSDLAISMRVEALILEGASRVDSLNQEKSDRLAFGELAAYEKAIVGRNLFAEYKPPPPRQERRVEVARPSPPPPPAFDKAKHATVTGIVERNNRPELWLLVKTTGEELQLAEGEEFTVGDMKCKVVRINLRDAELSTGDKHFVIKLQDNLRDASTAKSGEL